MIIKPNRKAVAPGGGGPVLISSFSVAPNSGTARADGTFSVGAGVYIGNRDLTVYQLGRYYDPAVSAGNRVVNVHDLDNNGVLLGSGTVLAATASNVDGMKRQAVTPFVLPAGRQISLSVLETGTEPWWELQARTLQSDFNDFMPGYNISVPGNAIDTASSSRLMMYSSPEMLYTVGGDPGGSASATYNGINTTIKGAWNGVYGIDGYDIPTVGQSLPSYVSGYAVITGATFDFGAGGGAERLDNPGGVGSTRPIYYTGPGTTPVAISMNVSGNRQLHCYVTDYVGGTGFRTVRIYDAATRKLLAVGPSGQDCTGGVWMNFTVSGAITIETNVLIGGQRYLSAIMFN
jgi:hypothetical protein